MESNILSNLRLKRFYLRSQNVVFEEPAQFYVDALEDSEVVVLNNKFMDLAHVVIPDFGLYNTLRLNDTIREYKEG